LLQQICLSCKQESKQAVEEMFQVAVFAILVKGAKKGSAVT
jgi:hypothetical protein